MPGRSPFPGLSGNALKLIAAALMVIDHVGLIFFRDNMVFRMIGRPALPIFAFFIAEGCRYTRSRGRYFLSVFGLGALCQIVYFLASGDTYLNILLTFSLGILVIYALQDVKDAFAQLKRPRMVRSLAELVLAVALVWLLNRKLEIDYGFWGCMLPVWASLLHARGAYWSGVLGKLDNLKIHVLTLMLGLLLTWKTMNHIQWYAFFALPLLLCYNGKRGNPRFKYWFYLFYPAHLVLLQGLALILQ